MFGYVWYLNGGKIKIKSLLKPTNKDTISGGVIFWSQCHKIIDFAWVCLIFELLLKYYVYIKYKN